MIGQTARPFLLTVRRSLVAAASLALATLWACGEAKVDPVGANDRDAIALVTDGTFEAYPARPIGEAADCYFQRTIWESLLGSDGFTYVNLDGERIAGTDAAPDTTTALLQFRIFRDTSTFTLNAMAVDGVAQPDSAVLAFVDEMFACEVTAD
jgi:hypothetical protein